MNETISELAEENLVKYVEQMQENRKNAVQSLTEVMELIGEQLVDHETHEEISTSVRRGLGHTLKALQALNAVTDMIINDLSGYVEGMQQTKAVMIESGVLTEALVQILNEKGLIESKELEDKYHQAMTEIKQKIAQKTS